MLSPDMLTLAWLLANRGAARKAVPHSRTALASIAPLVISAVAVALVVATLEIAVAGREAPITAMRPVAYAPW